MVDVVVVVVVVVVVDVGVVVGVVVCLAENRWRVQTGAQHTHYNMEH